MGTTGELIIWAYAERVEGREEGESPIVFQC